MKRKTYVKPNLQVKSVLLLSILAGSNPSVGTTSDKASTEYDALVREENEGFWD